MYFFTKELTKEERPSTMRPVLSPSGTTMLNIQALTVHKSKILGDSPPRLSV